MKNPKEIIMLDMKKGRDIIKLSKKIFLKNIVAKNDRIIVKGNAISKKSICVSIRRKKMKEKSPPIAMPNIVTGIILRTLSTTCRDCNIFGISISRKNMQNEAIKIVK